MPLIPIISSILYMLGGQVWKPARWFFIGISVAIAGIAHNHGWVSLLAIPAYFIATSAFPYGKKSWLNKFFKPEIVFLVCGLVFGACSFCILTPWWAIIQTLVSGLCWWFIKVLDDKGIVKNPWVELLRGLTGTIVYMGG